LVVKCKLLPDKTKKQVFPKNVGVPFIHSDNPFTALGMLGSLPGRFDTLEENVEDCVLELARSFQMLVHPPKLFYGAEGGKRLDCIFRPAFVFVHCVYCIFFVKRTKKSRGLFYKS